MLHLPPRTRGLLLAVGALYVGGALGMEVLGALAGPRGLAYLLASTLEEALEMVALALLLYAYLAYVRAAWGTVLVALAPSPVLARALLPPSAWSRRRAASPSPARPRPPNPECLAARSRAIRRPANGWHEPCIASH